MAYPNPRIVRLRLRYLAKATSPWLHISQLNPLSGALRKPSGPLPAAELLDANHIAADRDNGLRFLLTSNQKHIASPFTREQVDHIIRRYGYKTPIIITPQQFLEAAVE